MVALWGRSMGAVTALRYLHIERDLSICGILVDSPFTDLTGLIHHLAGQKSIPRFLTNTALWFISRSVQERADFDIAEVTFPPKFPLPLSPSHSLAKTLPSFSQGEYCGVSKGVLGSSPFCAR